MKLIEFRKRPRREVKRSFDAIEALLRIVDDWEAVPKLCQSAATKIAKTLLPATPSKPAYRYKEGKYGFRYSKALVKEYRDLQVRSRGYFLSKRAEQLRALFARRAPPPELYGIKQVTDDKNLKISLPLGVLVVSRSLNRKMIRRPSAWRAS